MIIGNKTFENDTYIMAIINLTPDSFYEKSRTTNDTLLEKVKKAIDDGASVIDIGGQSTRPGHTPVSQEEEWKRLEDAIKLIKTNFDIPLSVDTYYPYVAELALQNGADLINDIWGLQWENSDKMAKIIAKYNASVCIMQNQDHISQDKDLWQDIYKFFDKSLKLCEEAGIQKDKILLDGGIGFGKTKEQNHIVVNNYEKLHRYGLPLLLGTSRKSMFGGEVKDRLAPTLETTKKAVRKNVLFVRVHDIKENFDTIRQEKELLKK